MPILKIINEIVAAKKAGDKKVMLLRHDDGSWTAAVGLAPPDERADADFEADGRSLLEALWMLKDAVEAGNVFVIPPKKPVDPGSGAGTDPDPPPAAA